MISRPTGLGHRSEFAHSKSLSPPDKRPEGHPLPLLGSTAAEVEALFEAPRLEIESSSFLRAPTPQAPVSPKVERQE